MYDGSFQEAIAPILIVAQCFAVMPVNGVRSGSASKMSYHWTSVRAIYSYVVFIMMCIFTGLTISDIFKNHIEFDNIGTNYEH